MKIDFEGKFGIVTGAGRGMGRGFALDLARRGAGVVVNGRPPGEGGSGEAEAVTEEIRSAGGRAVLVYTSVESREGVDSLVDAALDNFGSLDFVINNAGILKNGSFEDLPDHDIEIIANVHLFGSFYLGQRAFKVMKSKGYGRIVNVSSTTALVGIPGLANYAAAKGGILGLTHAMAAEGAEYGIKVNALVPSAQGKMQAKQPIPGFAEKFDSLRDKLQSRLAPESVVPLAVYLASQDCERNGEIWTACAGRFARIATCFGSGWVAPDAYAVSAEDIGDNLDRIAAIDDCFEPANLEDIYRDIVRRLPPT